MSNNDRQDAVPEWTERVRALLADWIGQYGSNECADVVASPDVDGVLSILLLQRWLASRNRKIRLVAVYTTTELIVFHGATIDDCKRALWVDHDVLGHCRSIGNHLVQLRPDDTLPDQHPLSFNLNEHIGQSFRDSFSGMGRTGQDKYPFGTAHLLAQSLFMHELNALADRKPYHSLFAWLAHADGAWLTAQMYQPSAIQWYRRQFRSARWMRFMIFGYLLDEKRFAAHEQLIHHLHNDVKNIRVESSATSSENVNNFLSECSLRWKKCTGHQGMAHCTAQSAKQIEEQWMPAFGRFILWIGKAFGFEGAMPFPVEHKIALILRGSVLTPDPSLMSCEDVGAFPKLLKDHRAFSMAFTARRTLRYTVDLPELTAVTPKSASKKATAQAEAANGDRKVNVSSLCKRKRDDDDDREASLEQNESNRKRAR